MPISRDPRSDRRRRFILDGSEDVEQTRAASNRRGRTSDAQPGEANKQKRSAGYSQEVRRACGQRLVQLIPVRHRSYALVVTASLLIPGLLLLGHYLVYVLGTPRWYGHPLAILLDLSHQNGLATWLSSHLWLLCLTATVLTFQLRRHKLDDYDGEYRLWFWLVMTCLLASIDSTTRVSHLFGLALERWSQLNLGWSGPAVVQSTLIVLVGMLGLRLCTELKTVPLSLVFWLTGLLCWCGSTILSQDLLRVELTAQFRMWLRCSLWLSGLTCVWLAALTYLRHVYIDAQKRFLARGRLATAGVPLRERFKEAMPQLPSFGRHAEDGDSADESRWRMPAFMRRNGAEESEAVATAPAKRRRDKRTEKTKDVEVPQAKTNRQVDRQTETDVDTSVPEKKKSKLTSWIRSPKDSDEPDEYKKVARKPKVPATKDESEETEGTKQSWVSKLPRPKLPKPRMPSFKRKANPDEAGNAKPTAVTKEKIADEETEKKSGGFFSKLKLPSFRLPPPSEQTDDSEAAAKTKPESSSGGMRPVSQQKELPGTSVEREEQEERPSRPLTKAERKRLRRQKQNRAA